MAWMPQRNGEMFAAFTATLAAIQAAVTRLDGKVDKLTEDRVTRTDLNELRQTMETGFASADAKFIPHALADERFGNITQKLDEHEAAIKDLQAAPSITAKERFAQWTSITAIIIAAVSAIVAVLSIPR